jgi:hypothetical protein
MTSKRINVRTSILIAIILVAAFTRLIPHMTNFSPFGAIALFGAAYFYKKWQAFIIPLVATWLSDLFINNTIYAHNYNSFTWFYEGFYWQYFSYLLIAAYGLFMFKKVNVSNVVFGAIGSTAIFFIVTNFGSWIGNTMYPQNFGGLMSSYVAGIPFLKGTLFSNLLYTPVLFGSFAFFQQQFSLNSQKTEASLA